MDTLKFNCRITEKDLFSFYLYNAYRSSQGVISIVFGMIGIAAGIITFGRIEDFYSYAYIVLGILFFIYLPAALYLRAKAGIKTGILGSEMEYTVDNNGIKVRIKEEEAELLWDNVYKAVTKKDLLFLYSGMKNAYIIPERELGEKKDELISLFRENLKEHRLKIKW